MLRRSEGPGLVGIVAGLVGMAVLFATDLVAAPEASSFGDVVEVELVDVEVWVTDRTGRPVPGLGPEDFTVREDGEIVEITSFVEVRGGAPISESGDLAPLEPEEIPPATPTRDRAPTSIVVFLDQLNMGRADLHRMIDALRDLIAEVEIPADRILVLRHDGRLFTEVPFGSTPEALDAALGRLREEKQTGIDPASEKRRVVRQLQSEWEILVDSVPSPCLFYPRRVAGIVERWAEETVDRSLRSVRHLVVTSRFLAGRPGPKTLIYMGAALEMAPGRSLVRFVDEKCPRQREIRIADLPHLGGAYEELTHLANAHRVTVYTIQSSGLATSVLGGAENRTVVRDGGLEFDMRTSARAGLELLADRTGGRLLANRNRVDGVLAEVVREAGTYYSLAYSPGHAAEERDHRIEVDVGGKGLRVRHRQSYRHRGSDERMGDLLQSAVHLGVMSNPLGARIGSAGLRPGSEEGEILVPLRILVPIGGAVFLPTRDGEVARFRLLVQASGPENEVAAARQLSFSFPRPEGAGPETLLTLPVELEIRPGEYVVAVALRDEGSREISYVATTIGIDPLPASEGS